MPDLRVPSRVLGSVDADVDGQRIVLSPKDFAYLAMEGCGPPIWDLIDGARSIDEIISALETRFEAAEGTIRTEVLAFLDALIEAGLATVRSERVGARA